MKIDKYLLTLILLFVGLLLFLPWYGYYMLNDSFVYIYNAQNYFTNGFVMHPLTSPTLIFQTIVGAFLYNFFPYISIFRLISAMFYFLSLVAFYFLVKELGLNNFNSFAASLLYAFNPLVIYSGFSYMSEIYFMFLYIVSVYFYIKFLKNQCVGYLFLCVVTLCLSSLQRQTGLLLSAGLFLDLLVRNRSKINMFLFLIPIIFFIFVQIFFPTTVAYTDQSLLLTISNLKYVGFYFEAFDRLVKTFYYIGFFVFPVTISVFVYIVFKHKGVKEVFSAKFLIFFFIFLLISVKYWFVDKSLMFYIPNVISYAGFNPQNLGIGIKQTYFVNSPVRVRALITMLSVFSISYLILLVTKTYRYISNRFIALLLPSVLILLSSLIFRDYFDRYFIVLVPSIAYFGGFLSSHYNLNRKLLIFCIFPLVIFSVFFEHDYLSLNKKVWNEATSISENPKMVRATFEFNNYWYLEETKNSSNVEYLFGKEYLPKFEEYAYIIGYTHVQPLCTVREFTYFSLLSPKFKGNLILMEFCKEST